LKSSLIKEFPSAKKHSGVAEGDDLTVPLHTSEFRFLAFSTGGVIWLSEAHTELDHEPHISEAPWSINISELAG